MNKEEAPAITPTSARTPLAEILDTGCAASGLNSSQNIHVASGSTSAATYCGRGTSSSDFYSRHALSYGCTETTGSDGPCQKHISSSSFRLGSLRMSYFKIQIYPQCSSSSLISASGTTTVALYTMPISGRASPISLSAPLSPMLDRQAVISSSESIQRFLKCKHPTLH